MQSRTPLTTKEALEWNVPPGTSSSPSAKLRYQLSAPLRWWRDSIARILAEEIRKFPLRIQACLRVSRPRQSFRIVELGLLGYSVDRWREESKFQGACIQDMQALWQEYRWAGILDRRMAAEAYRLGVLAGVRKIDSESNKHQS